MRQNIFAPKERVSRNGLPNRHLRDNSTTEPYPTPFSGVTVT